LLGLLALGWCVLSGSWELAAGNKGKVWGRIDEEEYAMAAGGW